MIVAPEDLILSKLKWAQESRSELQVRDVRELMATGITLDREYLEHWAQGIGVVALLRDIDDG